MKIIELIPKSKIFDVDIIFDLLRKTTSEDNDLLEQILPNVNQKNWGNEKLINNNVEGDLIDLIFKIDEYSLPLYNKIELLDDAEASTEKNVENYLTFLKETYQIDNIYLSNAFSIKNAMLFLMYLKEGLESLQIQLELTMEDMLFYLKGKTFVIGVEKTRFDSVNGRIYLNNEADPLPVAFSQMIDFSEIKEDFFNNFKTNKINQNNFLNAQLFVKYLEDNLRIIGEYNLNTLNQYDFLFELYDWSVNYLDLEDEDFNNSKNSFVYQQYKEMLLRFLNDYNFKNYLEDESFKNMVFSISYTFKHLVRKKYVLNYWKDLFLIEQLTKSLVAQGYQYEDYEHVLDQFLFNASLLDEMKTPIVEEAVNNSFLGYLHYYREEEGDVNIALPTIEEERMIEKFFWEDHINVFKPLK